MALVVEKLNNLADLEPTGTLKRILSAQKFFIDEIPDGATLVGNRGDPISIEFSVPKKSMPLRPWTFGIKQRTARTDYPGGIAPTEQILGWNYTPFSLEGRLDDRYNTAGYAIKTRKLLELLVQRGNKVRLKFEDLTIEGVITDIEFQYRRSWDIGYRIDFSPHMRTAGGPSGKLDDFLKLTKLPLTAEQLLEGLTEIKDTMIELTTFVNRGLAGIIQDTLVGDILAQIDEFSRLTEEVVFAIDNRFLTSREDEPGTPIIHIANQFLAMATVGAAIRALTAEARSDLNLAYDTDAKKVMEFDDWHKETAYQARRAIFLGLKNGNELKERAKPGAKRLYRPQQGESFYSISNRFYGTPHNWRAIADRNYLSEFVLTGEELLIIPDIKGR